MEIGKREPKTARGRTVDRMWIAEKLLVGRITSQERRFNSGQEIKRKELSLEKLRPTRHIYIFPENQTVPTVRSQFSLRLPNTLSH